MNVETLSLCHLPLNHGHAIEEQTEIYLCEY